MKDKVCLALASVFGIGYIPFAPATFASVVAAGIFLLINNTVLYAVFTIIIIGVSFGVSGKAEVILKEKDSSKIVIDDFAGMALTLIFIPHDINIWYVAAGFALFRFFDIFKIYPANKMERFDGSMGVVGDDMVAGVYAALLLNIGRFLI